jgi:hypothetical protein
MRTTHILVRVLVLRAGLLAHGLVARVARVAVDLLRLLAVVHGLLLLVRRLLLLLGRRHRVFFDFVGRRARAEREGGKGCVCLEGGGGVCVCVDACSVLCVCVEAVVVLCEELEGGRERCAPLNARVRRRVSPPPAHVGSARREP